MLNMLVQITVVAVLFFLASRLAPPAWKGRIGNALKLYLTVAMVWFLLRWPIKQEDGTVRTAWNEVLDTISQVDATVFLWALLVATSIRMVGVMCSMYRWQLLLRGQGIEMPFRHVFGSFLIGRAIGFFLPSTAGLDAYLLYDAARFTGRTVEVTAGKFLEKVIGLTGIFLTFLVSLPVGIAIFGDNALAIAAVAVPISVGVLSALLVLLFFPGFIQWILENVPIPAKQRLQGLVTRTSEAAAAYRDKRGLVFMVFALSFGVHFATAVMYYFCAIAVGAGDVAEFWPIVFGSSIQIFATVIGPTIGGIGVREFVQTLTVGSMIGVGPAITSATLGFWAGEFPTLFGFIFWILRGDDYRPGYCRVDGEQVDYEEAAQAALALTDTDEHGRDLHGELPPLGQRVAHNAGLGLGGGILAGILVGCIEALVIAMGGFGEEAQVLWYGPFAYAAFFGALATLGGAVLGILPMDREDAEGWVPSLAMLATLVPFGLAITVFRLRRDVYLEQMPPLPVLLAVLAAAAGIALFLFFVGPKIFRTPIGKLASPLAAIGTLVVVMVGGAGAAIVFGPPSPGEPFSGGIPMPLAKKPNILLIMVDTLRADRLSCYGYEIETPNICGLAEGNGSRFQGFAHSSWTKPSTATLLTSLLPSTHNAMSKPSSLSDDVTMISEVLKEQRYTTGGIVSNINLAESFGFNQGYDEYHYLGPDYLAGAAESSSKLILYNIVRAVWFKLKPGLRFGDFYQDSEVVNEVAFEFLDRHKDDRFFLFLHYMDVHDPYFEHPYDGYAIARVSNQHPDPSLAEEMHRLYLEELEYLDVNIGKLFDRMRELNLYDDTLIALVADHGEEFYEHGGWWHGLTLYDEQIHVPFLVKWDRRSSPPPATATDEIARMIDVAPTLLGAAGAPIPAAMQGIDLRAEANARSPETLEVYSEEDHEGNVLWSLRTKSLKLIHANEGNPRGVPPVELYAVDADPGETTNLAAQRQADAEILAARADSQRARALGEAVQETASKMTPEECEQLKNLGYLSPDEDCAAL